MGGCEGGSIVRRTAEYSVRNATMEIIRIWTCSESQLQHGEWRCPARIPADPCSDWGVMLYIVVETHSHKATDP